MNDNKKIADITTTGAEKEKMTKKTIEFKAWIDKRINSNQELMHQAIKIS